jgi:hypothetical protein
MTNQDATPLDGKWACKCGFGLLQNPFPGGSPEAIRWSDEWREESRNSDSSKMRSDDRIQPSPQSLGDGPQS